MKFLTARISALLFLFAIQGFVILARATPGDDVFRGSGIYITQFGFSLHGSYEAGNVFLPKAPNSLDTVIDARAFGLPIDLIIPLHGSRSGDTITWNFDLSPSPPIDIGWPNHITRIQGALVTQASLLPGNAGPLCNRMPCPYNVQLTGLPASWATVTVRDLLFSNEHRVAEIRFIAQSGLPRSRLLQFELNRPAGRLCSRETEMYVSGRVATTSTAPTGGAWVNISSSDPAHVRVLGVNIPEGEQSAPVGLYIAAGWSGGVTLTASTGGVSLTNVLTIQFPSACSPTGRWSVIDTVLSCRFCWLPRWLNDRGDFFGDFKGQTVFLSPGWQLGRPLNELYQFGLEQKISPFRINNQEQLIGWFEHEGKPVGFFADIALGTKPREISKFEDAEVVGLNDLGVVIGTRSVNTRPMAFYFNGDQQFDVPLKAEWSRAVAVNNRGDIVVNMGTEKTVRAFMYSNRVLDDIGDLGGGDSTATALSEAGDVVGYAAVAGQIHGFIAGRGVQRKWEIKDLGTLLGFDEIRPTAVNRAGIVVGLARRQKGAPAEPTTGFLYSPATGLVDLNTLVPKGAARITEAVTINDGNQILVNGVLDGKQVSFIIQPNAQKGDHP